MKKFKEINDKNDPKMPLSLKNYILLLAGLIAVSYTHLTLPTIA